MPRICPGGHEISTNSIIYNIVGPFNPIGKNDTVRRFLKNVPLRLPTRASQARPILMPWCVKSMTIRNVFHLSLIEPKDTFPDMQLSFISYYRAL